MLAQETPIKNKLQVGGTDLFGQFVPHSSWHDHTISPQMTPFRGQLAPENIFHPRPQMHNASSDEECMSAAEEGEEEMNERTGNFDGNKDMM